MRPLGALGWPRPGKVELMTSRRFGALGLLAMGLVACAAPGVQGPPAGTGTVRGLVVGQSGKAQPLGMALVKLGALQTYTSNPPLTIEGLPSEASDPEATTLLVRHAFDDNGDGRADGPEQPAERRLLKHPPAPAVPGKPGLERYAFLRVGEFLFEAVPEGAATLSADFGGTSASRGLQVTSATTLVADLQLPLPSPIEVEGGRPRVVGWSGLVPAEGLSLVEEASASGALRFEPNPPDVVVRLKAPPGSAGATVVAYSVVYLVQTVAGEEAKRTPAVMGPYTVGVPPLEVPPAERLAFGPEVEIRVPLDGARLRALHEVADPKQRPSSILAQVEFLDDRGFALQGPTFENLIVSIPVRRR